VPTPALRHAAVQAARDANVTIGIAAADLMQRGHLEAVFDMFMQEWEASVVVFWGHEATAIQAIDVVTAVQIKLNKREKINSVNSLDESQDGTVFDFEDVHGGVIDNTNNDTNNNIDDVSVHDSDAKNAPHMFRPPKKDEVLLAINGINLILKPPQKTGYGYKDPKIDLLF
jgi:hypothetical protein